MKSFNEVFEDKTKYGTKIKTSEYCEMGAHLIIDQGQEQVAGYTDIEEGVFEEVPVIIFGDHTRVIKYVDKPFFLGADGVKVLRSKFKNANYKYLYYALKNARIPNTGYNRHFKWLKEVQIEYPDYRRQENVVKILDKVSDLIETRQHEIKRLDDLIKARFVELFGDPRDNSMGFEKQKLKDSCIVVTGNTPSRAIAEYYGDYVEWIKTDNIVTGLINPTRAKECLSEKGMEVGRIVQKDSILMTCIAGSIASIGRVCITDRTVAFNQQINAIIPDRYNVLFLYVLLQISKNYLAEDVNMALKGILSKSKLEEKQLIVPPIELQNQFADFVRQVDKSKFVEMFGSPVSNPMSWEKRTLKEVCIKLNDGSHFSPESFETGDYKYVTAKNIKFSGFDFSNITYVPEAVHRPIFDRCNPEFEDVLYIKDGATTGVAIVNTLDEEFTLLSSVALLKQDRSIMNGYFLATLLNNKDMYLNIRNNMGGAAITRLTIAKLNAIEIIVPPIELQNQFAAFVAEVDKSKLMFQKLHQKLNILQQKAGDI